MAESLFSLELLVHWVRLEPALGQEEEPAQPVVAFRLLDFPTLLIRPLREHRHPDYSTRFHFPFGRGKSCLFRGAPEALLGQLCRSPLYAMLLDVPSEPTLPRLLGSCPLSLAQAARDLLGELKGSPLPCVRAQQGLYPLQDLLGRPVGEMSLGYRLLSLGSDLERHFTQYASHKDNLGPLSAGDNPGPLSAGDNLGPLQAKDNLGPLPAKANLVSFPSGDNLGSLPTKATESRDTTTPRKRVAMVGRAVQTSPAAVSIQPMEGLEPQHPAEPLEHPKTDTSARLPHTHNEGGIVWSPRVPETGGMTMPDREEMEIEANMFCPPPMYYSRPSSARIENTTGPTRILDVPVASVFPDPRYLELKEECGPRENINPPISHTKPNRSLPRAPPSSGAALGQLPLLNALLLELSLLNQGSIGPPDHNPTVHPQLAWLYRPTDDCKPPTTDQDKSGQKAHSPSQSKRNKSTLTAVSVTTPIPISKTRILQGHAKIQNKKAVGATIEQPKRKLMYGLTNTLRLRLQHFNPDMLILHERRERFRKQQAESMKEKGGRPRSRGILAKSHGPRAKRGTHNCSVDENIETLIQSSRVDGQDINSSKHEEKTIQLKHTLKHVLRHHDENTERFNHNMTNPKSVEMVQSTPLQRALLLDFDTDLDPEHKIIAHSTYLDSRSTSTSHSQLGAQASGNGSPEHRSSRDLIDSLEYTAYSDDFTSPHYNASPDSLGGSPEPAKSRHTESDSDLPSLSKSSFSSKSESISAPIPLISNASPVQSFKRTHDLIKPHSLVNAVNVSNSDPDVLFQKSLLYQHAKITVSNVANSEVIPERLMTNGAEIRNTGSSQNVYDTSQSVRTSQMSSYMPSTVSDPQLSVLGSDVSDLSRMEERLSELGSPEFYKQYKPMSELVVNKLPGYTM